MTDLFENNGAEFSPDRKYRYALWRIWDEKLPLVMFIGLNPSTANETEVDPTIRSVMRISKHNGFGGAYMMNCFPLVSSNPDDVIDFMVTPFHHIELQNNSDHLKRVSLLCKSVVFAWGNFRIVQDFKRDKELIEMFPEALIIGLNKNGSPKHPLFCKGMSNLIAFKPQEQPL